MRFVLRSLLALSFCIIFCGTNAMAATRVAVLNERTPGVQAADLDGLAKQLSGVHAAVEWVDLPALQASGGDLRKRADWLVLPDATHVPDAAFAAIDAFARAGGSIALIGPMPFSHPVVQIDGQWRPVHDASARLSKTTGTKTPTRFEAFCLSTIAKNHAARSAAGLIESADRPAGMPTVSIAGSFTFAPPFAVPRDRVSRLYPLLSAVSDTGEPAGDIASLLTNVGGPYAGSNWMLVGTDLSQITAHSDFVSWFAKALTSAEPSAMTTVSRPVANLSTTLGVTHAAGQYHFTPKPFLTEGVDQLASLGTRSIKLWFTKLDTAYPGKPKWPACKTLTEIAQTEAFAGAFDDKHFSTYFLVAFSAGMEHGYWKNPANAELFKQDEKEFYDLTKYLLTQYRDTGKTFVLQNWEGDWAIRPKSDLNIEPTADAITGMIAWLNARQRGVDRARTEIGEHGVHVLNAAEVNQVRRSLTEGKQGVIDLVIPHTNVDLVSYSCYDTQRDPVLFRAALEYIAAHAPARKDAVGCRVYVGEYGLPETRAGLSEVQRTIPQVVDIALAFGCRYVLYWELYCNEPINKPVVTNDDAKGFWLIKPDGSKAWAWDYLAGRMRGEQ